MSKYRCCNPKLSLILQGSPYTGFPISAEREFQSFSGLIQANSLAALWCFFTSAAALAITFLLFFFCCCCFIKWNWKSWKMHELSRLEMLLQWCSGVLLQHTKTRSQNVKICSYLHIRKEVSLQWCSSIPFSLIKKYLFFGKHYHLNSMVLLTRSGVLPLKPHMGQ